VSAARENGIFGRFQRLYGRDEYAGTVFRFTILDSEKVIGAVRE
jgi:hypothetical protein